MDKSIVTAIIFASAAIMIGVLLYLPAIPQDIRYHDFADQHNFFAVPHFFNVITNFPFLVIGLMGVRLVACNHFQCSLTLLRQAYVTFFTGVVLTGFGSIFYHLNPDNQTLIWDRLPMTIIFMALVSIVVGEYIAVEAGKQLLYPLVTVGILSVVYWYWGELHRHGDLRFYALVQFLPLLLIPAILVFGHAPVTNNGYLWSLLGAYTAAKFAEYNDKTIYQLTGFFSGHSLKHLLAAAGIWFFYRGLKQRVRLS